MATYFIMTEVFECYDSRGKNCMMASWGPLEAGGDYVWYPIFYDIDTQLGINNTGIPSFEYNVDATEAGNFSTSDSILWNNFYRFFKKSYILMKYKHLKGTTEGVTWSKLSNPPLASIQDIENWYTFDPVDTDSIMARGVRPLIATNLDEYFKYITITNSLGKGSGITGYLDRNGNYTHDSNGTYFYALQGDRSQSRRQFLTNRLEYIDSWLNQGNYQRGGVNCIRGRVAANNATKTSDKWVETNNDTSPTGGSYYLEDGVTKRNEFDAQYWLDLTPIRSSYITVSDDSAAYPSQKYDGINTVKFNVTAIENGVRKSANYPEQLLYIYGMNQMADVGDLNNLYWQEFYIDGEAPKLTRLKVGHDGLDKDGNRWFNNKMNLPSIPASKESTGMPLLKEVNFCNITISTGSPSLDLTSCEKLEDFRATGSNFADILFAEGVALNTLYLPKSLTRLVLTEANLLTNLITEYEAPVEIDGKLTANPGLYIEGLFEPGNLDLHTIKLQGGSLGYDSYKLLSTFYNKKKSLEGDISLTLTKVNWCPYTQLVEGDEYDLAHPELYYIDNGHYGFEEYEYDVDTFNIQVLSGEIYKKENISADVINQIDDSGLDMLKTFISNTKFKDAIDSDKRPSITGIIYINNATQIDEGYIRNTLQEAYPGLKLFFNDVKPAYSAKFVTINEETGAYEYVPFKDGSTSMASVQKIS